MANINQVGGQQVESREEKRLSPLKTAISESEILIRQIDEIISKMSDPEEKNPEVDALIQAIIGKFKTFSQEEITSEVLKQIEELSSNGRIEEAERIGSIPMTLYLQ
jgi:hypothetical protein